MNFLQNLFSWQPVGGNQPDRICAEDFQAEWLLSVALRQKKNMHHPENKPPYAKVGVFLPRFIESNQRFELSSFCIEAMGENDVWSHLGEHCTKGLVHPLYGRADFVGRICETATPALSLHPGSVEACKHPGLGRREIFSPFASTGYRSCCPITSESTICFSLSSLRPAHLNVPT